MSRKVMFGVTLVVALLVYLVVGIKAAPLSRVGDLNDFDGDGKTDLALSKTTCASGEAGRYYILQGGTNYTTAFTVGFPGAGASCVDRPVAGDFDGDGRTDLGWYKRSGAAGGFARASDQGTWYIIQAGTGYKTAFAVKFPASAANDVPIPGDYDGDGKTDIAIFKVENPDGTLAADAGTVYVLQGGTNYTTAFSITFQGIVAADRPAPADYDGDGRLDMAWYKTAGGDAGTLYVLQGGNGFKTAFKINMPGATGSVGGVNDIPVPGDYDGDGRIDAAVYKEAGTDVGTWYIAQGGTNYTTAFAVKFPGSECGDKPTPGYWAGGGSSTRLDIGVLKGWGCGVTPADAGTLYVLQGGTNYTTAFSINNPSPGPGVGTRNFDTVVGQRSPQAGDSEPF